MARSVDAGKYRVIAAEEVVAKIMDEESNSVVELEAFLNKHICFQAESTYAVEQFDVVILSGYKSCC